MLGSTDAPAESKRARHADGGGGDAGDDRLSALPDDLLRAILSRLMAQQTVQTCVLSTRWRHLWRAVPCLDIDHRYIRRGFDDFTVNLLRGHDFTLLEDFRLHGANATVTVGDRWLRRDIGRDTWPRGLKRLHLSGLELKLKDIASHISSGCPALEDVQLERCWFFLTSNIKIASLSLKKLVVDGECTVDEEDEFEVFKLIIDAPALVSLRLCAELHHIIDTAEPHTMPSIVDASIHLRWIEHDVKHQLGILAALSNVTSLHLLHFAVTLLFNESHENLSLFKFENLRTLFLDECRISDDFLGLQQYLENSCNLHKLTLRHCEVLNTLRNIDSFVVFNNQQVLDFHPTKEVMERRQSYSKDLPHFRCKNLRLCDIIYREAMLLSIYWSSFLWACVGIYQTIRSNLLLSRRRRKNMTELTEVD